MKINTKNKKPLILITSSIASLALVSLPLATAISCGSTQTNSESVDNNNNNNGNNNNNNGSGGNGNTDNKPVVPPTEVKPEKPDPNSPIVNNEVIANDPFYEKYGTRLFDLTKFKGKTLDEIDINLIKSAMIPQDSSKVSHFYLQERNGSFIKNKDLNCFNIEFSVYLVGDNIHSLGESSYLTVFLPLSATSKETLNADQLKALASKATNDQYINSFKDISDEKAQNFQSLLCLDGVASYLKLFVNSQGTIYPYDFDETKFSYDLNNNEILKGSFHVRTQSDNAVYKEYNFIFKNIDGNIYEKVTINGKTFLRFTMAKDSIEISDVSKAVYKNQKEAVFYIDITTWNK